MKNSHNMPRVIAPAHPGCAQTDENRDIDTIEDVVFHYLEVLDALNLTQFDLVGSCVGGWIAAELAVRHSGKIRKLVLIGASGPVCRRRADRRYLHDGAARVRLELRNFARNASFQRRPPDGS